MKMIWATGLVLLGASGVLATNSCSEINGNWYCDAVEYISYSNFGTPGQFNKITTMANGVCRSTPQSYSGGMSPMNGEVSWHFRGPMRLKQFAYYTPGSGSSNQTSKPTPHQRRHGHQQFHQHMKEAREVNEREEKRDAPAWITATINGQVVSWPNPAMAQTPAPAPAAAPAPVINAAAPAATQTIKKSQPTVNAGAGTWGRQAYYNAEAGTADGLVFLNHMGGQGSGVFDYTWGNSLSYAAKDAKTGSANPVPLADCLLEDNIEIVVMSDKVCNGDCGTFRPGSVAYHGFTGESKLFLLEFSMPMSGKRGFNADMPAAWILNAMIPRTMQYGAAECSCWTSGCGEWDIFEVLDSGNHRCKSTWHGLKSMGDSNWFQRPTGGTQKAAVMFDGTTGSGHIFLLPKSATFDTSIVDSILVGVQGQIASNKCVKAVLPS